MMGSIIGANLALWERTYQLNKETKRRELDELKKELLRE
jgi:hypothetical protein